MATISITSDDGELAAAPTANFAGAGILYVEHGALKFRGSNGTVTEIAPA